jgi:sec-independent protein translocase protein TatA
MIGTQDIWIVLLLAFLLFGAKKLPELAKGLGQSMKEFRKATTEPDDPAPRGPAATPPTLSGPPSRRCGTCQTPLEAGWTYCPRCGAASPVSG